MVGALLGDCFDTGGWTRFGYIIATAREDNLLCRAGEQVPMHEFHHWDTPQPGDALGRKSLRQAVALCVCHGHAVRGFPPLPFLRQACHGTALLAACRKETL